MLFEGIGVAPGLAMAPCLIVQPLPNLGAVARTAPRNHADIELQRFESAVQTASVQLAAIQQHAERMNDTMRAEIIGAQLMMLTDPMLLKDIREKIGVHSYHAVWAVKEATEAQADILKNLADPYLSERAADIRDIGARMMAVLLGIQETDLSTLSQEVILVGKEITPSQMVMADKKKIRAIVAETGGKTSHTAILANNMDLPAVLGCRNILAAIKDGEMLLVDGDGGWVETDLSTERKASFADEAGRRRNLERSLQELAGQPARTKDGHRVELAANIMDTGGAARAEQLGADGIGLFRTEFLFMDRIAAPTEEEQFEAYAKVLKSMNGKRVIIRTMDIGGDKQIDYLQLPKEENPFLGYRAIRVCLQDRALFMNQLRAILRAGIYGKAMIMYPMISSWEELAAANRALAEAKAALLEEGLPFDAELKAGIMVEVPSAAATADLLIDDAAFFSIGSNDLTQYTLAVDRMNEKVNNLYCPFHPGVLRLVARVIDVANKAGGEKFVGMCGEMASDPLATLLLLGLGLQEFSVNPSSLLKIKKIITSVEMTYARKVAEHAMKLKTSGEVVSCLTNALPSDLRAYLRL